MSGDSKEVEKGWQKKAGLDLRLAKPQIYKDELSNSQKENRVVPKTNSAQVHANAVKRVKKRKASVEDQPACAPKKSQVNPQTNDAQLYANAWEQLQKGKALGADELAFRDCVKKNPQG